MALWSPVSRSAGYDPQRSPLSITHVRSGRRQGCSRTVPAVNVTPEKSLPTSTHTEEASP